MEICFVSQEDSQAILDIYAYYVENSVFTFEYDVPTIEEFTKRIENTTRKYPYIVAKEDNTIVGYAYASGYRARAAYQWGVELSIYLNPKIQHQGIGTKLYSVLLNMLKELGYFRAYACITIPNPTSIAFHQKFNFKEIGVFHKCGYKHEQWLDVIWLELNLQDGEPQPIRPIEMIKNKKISI
ncbi:MAG: GNAT family N-acetyltransferase [Coprobacillaceae bacterium]